jgi:CHAT domain-containing protein
MTIPSASFSIESQTIHRIMDFYAILAKLAGKKKRRQDFLEALMKIGGEIGFGLESIFEHFGFPNNKRKVNLTLKLDNQTRRIPWELGMLPNDPDHFLCERNNVGRAFEVQQSNGWFFPDKKTAVHNYKALVAGIDYKKNSRAKPLDYSELDAKAVHNYLRKFSKSKKGKNLQVLPKKIGGNAKKASIEKRFQEGVTLFHFSGHGSLAKRVGSIVLADNKHLTTKEVNDLLEKAPTRAPTFSFMNACETCLQKPDRWGVYDWAHTMANNGARALIGTFWSVIDEDATNFSLEFYKNFLQGGRTIGESVRRARLYVRDKSDEEGIFTWPAFVLYGPPTLKAKDVLI